MRPTHWPVLYIILGTLVVIAAAVSQVFPDNPVVQRFGPNFATEMLAILLTLVFVQRFLERQDRVRRLRSSLGALRRGSRALTRLIEVWAVLVKGGLRNPPRYPPDSMLELLEPHNTQSIGEIDPRAPAAPAQELGWAAWAARELEAVRESLREVIQVYGTTLDAEYVEALDGLIDDDFIEIVRGLAVDIAAGDGDWQVRIRQNSGAREGHFQRIAAAVQLHNQLAREAAAIRDPKRLPQTRGVGVDLPADWDLRVHHSVEGRWWKSDPAPGSLRLAGARWPVGQ